MLLLNPDPVSVELPRRCSAAVNRSVAVVAVAFQDCDAALRSDWVCVCPSESARLMLLSNPAVRVGVNARFEMPWRVSNALVPSAKPYVTPPSALVNVPTE